MNWIDTINWAAVAGFLFGLAVGIPVSFPLASAYWRKVFAEKAGL